MTRHAYVHSHAVACALGGDRSEVAANLFSAAPPTVAGRWRLADGREVPVGALPFALGELSQPMAIEALIDTSHRDAALKLVGTRQS